MTTEISAAAAVALHWFLADQSATTLDAIQHGINLAVAEKDKEIRRLSVLLLESQPLNVRLDEQVRSKDKRITELEGKETLQLTAYNNLFQKNKAFKEKLEDAKETAQSKDREIERLPAEVIALEFDENTAKHLLTEANAKLAEAEEKILDETRLKEIWIVKASNTADQLSSAQAEIERLKVEIDKVSSENHDLKEGTFP